jgi:putative flavoprotein involved in K+ transport
VKKRPVFWHLEGDSGVISRGGSMKIDSWQNDSKMGGWFMHYHTVIVGGGQAGLGVSYYLAQKGIEHTVLEQGDIGESWQTQRWDSFTLNTPNSLSALPGDENSLENPGAFMSRDEFVDYLQNYARRSGLPVRTGTAVSRISKNGNGTFQVETSSDAMTADNVVIACGNQNQARVPKACDEIPDSILQLHSGNYKRPDALPEGAVLVIGSGQSGVQIVEDLLEAGHKVYLATSKVGRVVRALRGRDLMDWAVEVGFYDQTMSDLEDSRMASMAQPQISGTRGGHTVSLQGLEKMGAILLGRLQGCTDGKLQFADNLAENIIFADQVSAKFRGMVEGYIAKQGIDAPPAEEIEADLPDPAPQDRKPPTELDPVEANITSLIWCTGFNGDFSWIDDIELDEKGVPVHEQGVSPQEGLYFCGFSWLRKRKSGLIYGISEDAAYIADQLAG